MTKFDPSSVPGLSVEICKLAANIPSLEVDFPPGEAAARIEDWMLGILENVPHSQRSESERYLRKIFRV